MISLLSKISSPSIIIKLSLGGEISKRIDCPFGITTLSPSCGRGPFPHVVVADHLSIYWNPTDPISAANPFPVIKTLNGSSLIDSRVPVVHLISVSVTESIVHETCPIVTLTSDLTVPNPVPEIVICVPPKTVPCDGVTAVKVGVKFCKYWNPVASLVYKWL